ncbi:YihY/virulence factor BrkB family protein [Arthrobacter sp. TMN-37]
MAKTPRTARSAEPASPADRDRLVLRVLEARQNLTRAERDRSGARAVAGARLSVVLARLGALRPVRALQLYALRRGALLAAGIAYRMFFAIAAMLVAGFSILGLVIAGDIRLQELIVETVGATTPGLIDTGGGGLATREELFSGSGFGTALVVATVVMLISSLVWMAGIRAGMRSIFALGPVTESALKVILKDLAVLVVLAVALLVTTGVGFLANTMVDFALQLVGLTEAARPLTQLAGFTIMLVLDTAVAAILLHTTSAIDMPRRVLLQAALFAGVGSTVLRTVSASLLGGLGDAPLLAPFAVILGLFVWFYLLSQVYLMAAAWAAVGTADAEALAAHEHREKAGTLRQQSRKARRGS